MNFSEFIELTALAVRDSRFKQSLPVVLSINRFTGSCEMNVAEVVTATVFFSYSNLRPVTVLSSPLDFSRNMVRKRLFYTG